MMLCIYLWDILPAQATIRCSIKSWFFLISQAPVLRSINLQAWGPKEKLQCFPVHYVKIVFGVVLVRIFSYSVRMRENTEQTNSEYGYSLHNGEYFEILRTPILMSI